MEQNVPKSVLEGLNVMDEKEYRRRERLAQKKCQEAMERIDWHMMDGHLNSPEARQAYNEICNQLRVNFLEIPRFLGYKVPDPYLQLYCKHFQSKPSYKESMLIKWTRGKLLVKERMPLFMCIGALMLVSFAAGRFVERPR